MVRKQVIGKANESNLDLSDAQKPCSTCVKSHRFAAFGNPDLLQVEPECTYDNIVSEGNVVKHRTKYQVLEGRIQLFIATAGPSATPLNPLSAPAEALGGSSNPSLPEVLDPLAFLPLDQFNAPSETQLTVPLSNDSEQQLTISGWPIRLPKPDLFYHLVDVFFTSYPHAHYIIHRPSFMLSLALSPKSPDFPHVSLLHAICAYAGVFSYLIEPPPAGDLEKIYRDFIFGDRRRPDTREISFAEMHTQWAEEAIEQAMAMGFNLLECMQAGTILSGFYACQGRWVELWSTLGDVLRVAVPLGLNSRTGFRGDGTAHLSETPETLLPDPTNCVEEETRVNLFWVAYANERLSESPGSWAMCLDDQDIHQVVPGDLLHFEAGNHLIYSFGIFLSIVMDSPCISKVLRYSTRIYKMLTRTLEFPATILVSKVKSFNLRIRFKYPKATDLRELVEFQELEQSVASFSAMILLHDKHANLYSPNCQSAHRIIAAARTIVELLYAISSTSYDITRLPPIDWLLIMLIYSNAGEERHRFWYATRIDRGSQEEAMTIDLEIQSIRREPIGCIVTPATNVGFASSSNWSPSAGETAGIASTLTELQSLFPENTALP
ncbi:fungal specific transcription factor domain-containing protein [Rhizoctonia solani AG-1 IA]|uniref:Fungal specific transcription factor domain-containing protein n=1 Tax=Thanatephorus cucumeris (strain AG1-IA) TaxID=983506 RepID=L8WJP6_THACA|nr:fungal specific transcription factor domain-containing protein [Rhizoctonia solani AG-1 IA]